MTETLRTALVGCGKVGDTHAQALATLPQSEFVAAFDVDQGRADAFAQKFGAKGYANLEEMIDDAGVQTISICTPHPTHADVIVRAAAKGVHTLVEKPLASDLADADRAINAGACGRRQAGRGEPAPPLPARGAHGPGHRRRQDRLPHPGHAGRHGLARRSLLPVGPVAR